LIGQGFLLIESIAVRIPTSAIIPKAIMEMVRIVLSLIGPDQSEERNFYVFPQ
jgi:hypothetical protein